MTIIKERISVSRFRHHIKRHRIKALVLAVLCSAAAAAQSDIPGTALGPTDSDCTALRAQVEQLQAERDRLRRQLSLLSKQLDQAHEKLSALRKIEQSINRDNSNEAPP